MSIYYVKQDDSYQGCSDPGCCGESYDGTEISFVDCESDDEPISADHLRDKLGGGEVLKWRKANYKELRAWDGGEREGFYEGIKYERSRVIELLEQADSACSAWAVALIKGENE